MVDDNRHAHRRFSPGDQALLVKRCPRGDNCCVTDHIGKVVVVVAYVEEVIPTQVTQIFNDILEMLGSTDRIEHPQHDYIVEVEDGFATVFDYQLVPLGGYTEKDPIPEKPEVVH